MTDWLLVPVAALAVYRNGFPFKPEDRGVEGLPIVRIEQFQNPNLGVDRHSGEGVPPTNLIETGDLIFSWSGTLVVGFWDRGPALLNQHLFRVDPLKGVDIRWLRWALTEAIERMKPQMHGSAMTHITRRVLEEIRVPVPPLEVQRRIADYLDTETARIDSLIEKQAQLTELLRERWAGSVATAVDAAAPRTNGARLKHVVRSVRQGWSPQCHSTPADSDEAWAVLKAGASNGGVFRPDENKALPDDMNPRPDLVVEAGDLVISRANTRELVGSAAVVNGHFPHLMLSDKLYALRLEDRVASPEYVAMALGTRRWRGLIELNASGSSSSMQNITREDILNLPMDLPTLEEQEQILLSLRQEAEAIDHLMTRARRFTELLRERRQALITAAVTGELEV